MKAVNRDTVEISGLIQHKQMPPVSSHYLKQVLAASTEPMLLVRIDRPDWPVVMCNPAFLELSGRDLVEGKPFPDVVGPMIGREMMREASAAIRTQKAAALPVDVGSREYLLTLLPFKDEDSDTVSHLGVYLRTAGLQMQVAGGRATMQALAHATRRVRDLSGEDPVTGLLNRAAFRKILSHDWAVAGREGTVLGIAAFRVVDFDAYAGVFGQHGADSCQKRIAKTIGRFLRRASDVTARLDGDGGGHFVVLAHGSSQQNLGELAARIAAAVRALGLHHPRAKEEKFVTVSFRALTFEPRDGGSADKALGRLLDES